MFALQFLMAASVVSGAQIAAAANPALSTSTVRTSEIQVTHSKNGHVLTNTRVWSPDGEWIVYDVRSDPAGDIFDSSTIETVNVRTHEVKRLYGSKNGAHCGVATFHPKEAKVIFILGPENPNATWQYGPFHRQGLIVAESRTGVATNLDARDLTPPFTPGALRGGSHVHVWDGGGEWVSFTYEDHVLAQFKDTSAGNEINLRNIGVAVPGHPVTVAKGHIRNHSGEYFSVLVTRTVAAPKPGSDEIRKAFEEGWIGTNGYLRSNGTQQTHALAFQGEVVTETGQAISEVFISDLPDDLTIAGDGPLEGTPKAMPAPPRGTIQRRLTRTTTRKFPGIQGPRHWLRSSPDGSLIACLMKDNNGIVQLWTIPPNGGVLRQLTTNLLPIASTFTWSPDGRFIAHLMDNSVCITDSSSGTTRRLTPRSEKGAAPRPEACVFSPDGKQIAYVRRVADAGQEFNQIFVVNADAQVSE